MNDKLIIYFIWDCFLGRFELEKKEYYSVFKGDKVKVNLVKLTTINYDLLLKRFYANGILDFNSEALRTMLKYDLLSFSDFWHHLFLFYIIYNLKKNENNI